MLEGDHRTDRRRVFTLCITESAPDPELNSVVQFHPQRSESSTVSAAAGDVRNHSRLSVLKTFDFKYPGAAPHTINGVRPANHQPFATKIFHPAQLLL